jgi:DNA-directed RNA polymerase subunit alpha
MSDFNVILPSKPKVVEETELSGSYEIDGLYPGYGHTLGNSLRRIILSSLPGASITHVKIDGVSHEFSTLEGVKEDVITILLNLKRVRIKMLTDEPQTLTIDVKGPKEVTAKDIVAPGQVEIINKDQVIANVTGKVSFKAEFRVEKGMGYVSKENLQKDKVDIGTISYTHVFNLIVYTTDRGK